MEERNLGLRHDADQSDETREPERVASTMEETASGWSPEMAIATNSVLAVPSRATDPQGPVTKAVASGRDEDIEIAREAVFARIKAERRRGDSRPLAILAGKEAALHEASASLAALLNFNEKRPDPNLLTYQLTNSLRPPAVGSHRAREIKRETVSLYAALESKDPIETMLDRSMVGLSNAIMDCFERAAQAIRLPAREVNLRYAMKGVATLCEIVKVRENRRGQVGRKVLVGNVNVEAGGQAIVGEVKTKKRRIKASKSRPSPSKKAA